MARLFFITLLIVLLPLRGWTVERMAHHMATQGGPEAQQVAVGMPADCPMMADVGEAPPTTERTCQSCQLCMGLGAPEMPTVQSMDPAPRTGVVHRTDCFASADISRVSKPPIF